MIREINKVPGHQRVHIVDEVDDPENPGKKISRVTETTANNYVKVMGERIAAEQQIVKHQQVSLATHNLNLQQEVLSKDAQIAKLIAELAALKGEELPSPEPDGVVVNDADPDSPSIEESKKPDLSKDLDLTNAQAANLSNTVKELNKNQNQGTGRRGGNNASQ